MEAALASGVLKVEGNKLVQLRVCLHNRSDKRFMNSKTYLERLQAGYLQFGIEQWRMTHHFVGFKT
uniref:Uncharacterized protein n=1 Tax=Leersia perrieri TaxID=77586 RepID=A0A0D9XWF0_9ORYZ